MHMLEMDEIPEEFHHLFGEEYLGDRNIFRVWANNPAVMEATLEYLKVLYGQLTERQKELVILTVARAKGAAYEWHQHVDIAHGAGVSLEEMRAIGRKDYREFADGERALIVYTEAVQEGTMAPGIHEDLEAHYDASQEVAIGLLVGFYDGLCNYVNANQIPIEGEFVGWEPERVPDIEATV
jgi:alkylhydroperoxidase family enzyme